MTKYVIVGNGVAGATAADKIRALDKDGPITIFSAEPTGFYYRVGLPEVVAGESALPKITIHSEEWYRENRIELLSGESAVSVDPDRKTVVGDKGTQAEYDELLIAAGAYCFKPPVQGAEKKGVFVLRTYQDAVEIAGRAGDRGSAILIGGGLLGLEAGYGLVRRGLTVHVVEMFDRLLPRQMDAAGAALLQKHLESKGFSFYLGAKAGEILGQGEAAGLQLADGTTIDGSLVLFSAGIRPNLDLARALELDLDKGVKVDDRMQTSRDHVWAAGDLVEHRERFYGIWPAAREQGAVAGTNMAGGEARYEGTVMANTLKVVGVDLTAAGNIDPEGKLESAVYEGQDIYRKIVIEDGRIAGFIFYGTTAGVRECQKAMESGADVGHLKGDMGEGDFDFARLAG